MRPIATTDGDSAGVERATVEIGSLGPSVPPSDVDARPTPSGAGRMPCRSIDPAKPARPSSCSRPLHPIDPTARIHPDGPDGAGS